MIKRKTYQTLPKLYWLLKFVVEPKRTRLMLWNINIVILILLFPSFQLLTLQILHMTTIKIEQMLYI